MPDPLFTAEGRRNYIANSVSLDDWRTRSGAAIFNDLQAGGLGIREQDFYAIRREVLDLYRYQEQIEALKPTTRVPRAWMSDKHRMDMKNDYQYRFRVEGLDPETGDEVEAFYSISTGQELTKQNAEDAIMSMLIGEEDFYEIVVKNATLYQALHMPGVFG